MTLAEDLVDQAVEASCGREVDPEDWDVDALKQSVGDLAGLPADTLGALDLHDQSPDEMHDALWAAVKARYTEKEQTVETEILRRVERDVMLQIVDTQWERPPLQPRPPEGRHRAAWLCPERSAGRIQTRELRAVPSDEGADRQRDGPLPLAVATDPARRGCGRPPRPALRQSASVTLNDPGAGASAFAGAPAAGRRPQPARTGGDDAAVRTVRRDSPKVGRNDPCPCGSGKKYKKMPWGLR